MKRIILLMLLTTCTISMNAQWSERSEDAKMEELRQQIGIDYSMPDFSTSKIDSNIIGTRLAQMLLRLQDNYSSDAVYNQFLSRIVCEQNDGLDYVTIVNFKVKNISKSGDVITIKSNVRLGKNPLGIKNTNICMVFINGVSDNKAVNSLFSNLARYIKEEKLSC